MTDPVLVVGAGPVGLVASAELARRRVPVRIIDQLAARRRSCPT
jgi:2-polyprenyl-6-methoxyphenol hydroxylase-like FAD-dependent oxidoreductase